MGINILKVSHIQGIRITQKDFEKQEGFLAILERFGEKCHFGNFGEKYGSKYDFEKVLGKYKYMTSLLNKMQI